ncbi:lipid-binding putative hydrolase [Flavobacterium sp. 9]|uniref:lipid-binding protein n=1 Tax=Flavobacterium sp. 9 TaxID=2035198 RepID=UPI000C194A79|nr:lipid-binding protein [Flavobacterium sp. 9]PIF31456.1 lipid-binding putative hydrolase [Flavobacterium sp. 9]
MKSKIIKGLLALSITLVFTSCNNDGYDEYKPLVTPSIEMNGDWYIDGSNTSKVLFQHSSFVTSDTNEGNNTMYIDDRTIGYLKGKITVDTKSLTFSTTNSPNLIDEGTFTITEGKILKGAAHSKTGNVTDSIYFKGVFSYAPTEIITFAGHKKTGFLEDNY